MTPRWRPENNTLFRCSCNPSVTTVAAFLPLFLLSGASGEYAFSLAAVVALTLTGSWIAAIHILPALTVWFLGRSRRPQQATGSSTPGQALYASILGVTHSFLGSRSLRMLRTCGACGDAVQMAAQADVSAQ